MLIESYDLEIEVSKHSVEEFEYEAIAHLNSDITPVLPYLNAYLRNATYLPDIPALSWRQGENKIGFWPDRIAADHLKSRDSAEHLLRDLVGLVNSIWDIRDEITPESSTREKLQPLEIFRKLPRTSCKLCGEDTCFNFALKIAAGQLTLNSCSPLFSDDAYQSNKSLLEEMVSTRQTLL